MARPDGQAAWMIDPATGKPYERGAWQLKADCDALVVVLQAKRSLRAYLARAPHDDDGNGGDCVDP